MMAAAVILAVTATASAQLEKSVSDNIAIPEPALPPGPPAGGTPAATAPIPPLEPPAAPDTLIGPDPSSDDLMRKIQSVNEQMQQDAEKAVAAPSEPGPTETIGPAERVSEAPASSTLADNALRAAAALCLVLALILFLTLLVRRFGPKTGLAGPALGKSLGRLYLAPRTAVHFVQCGAKILVVGTTPNAISLLASFDAATFMAQFEQESKPRAQAHPADANSPFVAELRASLRDMAKKTPLNVEDEERELAALRAEVRRLQRNIQETAGADKD